MYNRVNVYVYGFRVWYTCMGGEEQRKSNLSPPDKKVNCVLIQPLQDGTHQTETKGSRFVKRSLWQTRDQHNLTKSMQATHTDDEDGTDSEVELLEVQTVPVVVQMPREGRFLENEDTRSVLVLKNMKK